jgi:hypothetical protein
MEVIASKLGIRVRCDMAMCKEVAEWSFGRAAGAAFNRINLCGGCMKEIYSAIGKLIVPSSPMNVVKREVEARSGSKKQNEANDE